MIQTHPEILMLLAGVIFLTVYFTIDGIITRIRLKINQKEWDEYSREMTEDEKYECFTDFLWANRIKHSWPYLYIPRM